MSKKNHAKKAEAPAVTEPATTEANPKTLAAPPKEVNIPVSEPENKPADVPTFMPLEAGQGICASYGGHSDTDEACTNPAGNGQPCEIAADCIAYQASIGAKAGVGVKKAKKAASPKNAEPTRVSKTQTWEQFQKMVYSEPANLTKLVFRALIEENSYDEVLARMEREEKAILGKEKPFYTPGAYSKLKAGINWSVERGIEFEEFGGFIKLVGKHVVA